MNASMTPEQRAAVREYLGDKFDREKSTFQISVFGAARSGRRSILVRLAVQHFLDTYDPTDDGSYRMQVYFEGCPAMVEFTMQLCDGLEGHPFRDHLVKGGEAYILVYDVNNRPSFDRLRGFYDEALTPEQKRKAMFVLANKNDRPRDKWVVSEDEGEHFSRSIGARFRSASAFTGEGLQTEYAAEMAAWVALNRIAGMTKSEEGPVIDEGVGKDAKQSRFRFSLNGVKEKVKALLQ